MVATKNTSIKQGSSSSNIIYMQTEMFLKVTSHKYSEVTNKTSEQTGITQDRQIISVTRWRVIKVKYLKGITTVIGVANVTTKILGLVNFSSDLEISTAFPKSLVYSAFISVSKSHTVWSLSRIFKHGYPGVSTSLGF